MYLIIDSVKYTRLHPLSFAPETDLTGDGLAINQFQADIITDDAIAIGRYAALYDDRDRLWAKYWITYAERLSRRIVRVIAKSEIELLEREKLPAAMWQSEPVTGIVWEIMSHTGGRDIPYRIDPAYAGRLITGYAPEQTPRERLQLLCLYIGAHVRTYGAPGVQIVPLPEAETFIPMDKTFWRPSTTYRDWVTRLTIRDYEYEPGEPETTDEYVTVGDTHYIQTWFDLTFRNPDAPAAAPENEVLVEKMTLSAASVIAGRLGAYYFGRMDVTLDVINNGEYWPGDRVIVHTDENALAVGHIKKCDFKFGLQARASITVSMAEVHEGAPLEIVYTDEEGRKLAGKTLLLPTGYEYAVDTVYIDITVNGTRTVWRPLIEQVTGTLPEAGDTATVPCAPALIFEGGVLRVISVDGVDMDAEGVVTIE